MTETIGTGNSLDARLDEVYRQAVGQLFSLFEKMCEGAIAVDDQARIAWINDKYRQLLGLPEGQSVVGVEVEEIIPHSQMRSVVKSGRPILLDVMPFGSEWFVVTRLPVFGEDGKVLGGVGYVLYDRLDYLKPLVNRFLELQREIEGLRRELSAERRTKYTISSFIGSGAQASQVKRLARRAARLDAPILLLGETGTGKELLAHGIHAASARADRPFVPVNVAAVPEGLLESEFFGAAPGAYTGAERRPRIGKLETADGGTLFLDELADMPLSMQAKLLRVLQDQEFERLGSNRVIKVDVRIVAATGQDLEGMVDSGRFRADLYYRLNVLPIHLPPMRERIEDLEQLANVILDHIAVRAGARRRELDRSALEVLATHDWPGNVRELQNILERACMLTDRIDLTAGDFATSLPPSALARDGKPRGSRQVRPLAQAIAELERASIRAALEASGGKKTAAARLLGISRSSFYQKVAEYGLESYPHS